MEDIIGNNKKTLVESISKYCLSITLSNLALMTIVILFRKFGG